MSRRPSARVRTSDPSLTCASRGAGVPYTGASAFTPTKKPTYVPNHRLRCCLPDLVAARGRYRDRRCGWMPPSPNCVAQFRRPRPSGVATWRTPAIRRPLNRCAACSRASCAIAEEQAPGLDRDQDGQSSRDRRADAARPPADQQAQVQEAGDQQRLRGQVSALLAALRTVRRRSGGAPRGGRAAPTSRPGSCAELFGGLLDKESGRRPCAAR